MCPVCDLCDCVRASLGASGAVEAGGCEVQHCESPVGGTWLGRRRVWWGGRGVVDCARGVQCAVCWDCADKSFCLLGVLCGCTRSASSGSAVGTLLVVFVSASAVRCAPTEL